MARIARNKSDLAKRLIFGFGGFFLFMFALVINVWTYFIIFLVLCYLTLNEFFGLGKKTQKRPLKIYAILFSAYFYTLCFLFAQDIISGVFFYTLFPLLSLFYIIILYRKDISQTFDSLSYTFLGILYVTVPLSLLHFSVLEAGFYNHEIIIGIFFTLWIHDITAYFVGSQYGKTLLFPRISPKKSWEGSISAGATAILMSLLISYYFRSLFWWQWFGIALIIIVISTFGDLVESMFKRNIQLKDSSNAIPGHGGFLDRFDGFLFSIPSITAFLQFF